MDINAEIEVKKTQGILLEILDEILRVCDEEHLNVFLGGGSLIGALRHKGFIPWDDDIDLFMPREDYEKLYAVWDDVANKRFAIIRTDENLNYHFRAIGIADTQTTLIKKYNVGKKMVHGLFVDIMPIDGIPQGKFLRGKQLLDAFIFNLYNVQRGANFEKKYISILATIALKCVPGVKLKNKIWKSAEKRMCRYSMYSTEYCKELTTKIRAMFRPLPSEWFINYKFGEFEGRMVKIPSGAEIWMEQIYGNYMELPPIEKQMPIHDTTVLFKNLDKPYSEYKGVYF